MRLNHATSYGEPKTCAGRFRTPLWFATPSDVEDPGEIVVLDASTPVGHIDACPAIWCPPRADQNLAVHVRMADRVAHEIRQSAGELVAIALHGKAIRIIDHVYHKVYMPLPGMFASLTDNVVGKLDETQRASGLRRKRGHT